jgi:DNA repair protein RAD50
MLASIIIRLAIAKAFSNNTLMLALDEPTNNLDRENINHFVGKLSRLLQFAN